MRKTLVVALLMTLVAFAGLWYILPPTPDTVFAPSVPTFQQVRRLTFSRDGRTLAIETYDPNASRQFSVLSVRDVEAGEEVMVKSVGGKQLESMAFSPDGKRLAIRWFDGDINVWKTDTNVERTYPAEDWKDWNPHMQIAFSPEGRLLLYGPDPSSGKLWDVETKQLAHTLFDRQELNFASSYAAGQEGIVVASGNNQANVWSFARLHAPTVFKFADDAARTGRFDVSPDGRFLADFVNWDRVQVWEVGAAGPRELSVGSGTVGQAISPDGSSVAMTGTSRPPPQPPISWIYRMLAIQPSREEVRIFDVDTGRLRATIDRATIAKYSPDGNRIAVAGEDGAVRIYALPIASPWWWIVAGSAVVFTVVCLIGYLTQRRKDAKTEAQP